MNVSDCKGDRQAGRKGGRQAGRQQEGGKAVQKKGKYLT